MSCSYLAHVMLCLCVFQLGNLKIGKEWKNDRYW